MTDSNLEAGGLLLLLLAALTLLPPRQLLFPTPIARWGVALGAGLASVLAQSVLLAPGSDLLMAAYPTVAAVMALYFGLACGSVVAGVTLAAAVFLIQMPALPAALLMALTLAAGAAWRQASQRGRLASWQAMVGLAFTVPMLVYGCALALLGRPAASDFPALLRAIPWYHAIVALFMGLALELLFARARAATLAHDTTHTLLEREQQLNMALDAFGGGRWEWDVATRRYRCFGSFYEQFGITRSDQDAPDLWDRWYALRHPEDRARNAERLERAMQGRDDVYESEFRVRDTTGRWHWLISRGAVSDRDASGAAVRLVGMDVDVTAQREATQALQVSEAKYTMVYQTPPDPAGISRVSDGQYVDVNPAFCELFGLTREQVIGRTSTELHVWASPSERQRLLSTFERDGKVDRLPLRANRAGRVIPGLMSARTAVIEGENCFVFVFHDISEAQQARDEQMALNSLLQQAGRLARLGAWVDERGKGLVYWSDVCFDIHGLPRGAALPTQYIDTMVVAQYREPLRERFRSSIRHRSEWSMEMEVLHAQGRTVWVRARGEPVIENGRVTHVRGVMQDIDDSKRAEQRLRQSEDRFSRIFHLMPFPMGLSRAKTGQYVDINPAWVSLMGFTRQEAIGRTAMDLGIVGIDERLKMLEHVDENGQLNSHELTLRIRNGQQRTVLQSMRSTEFDGERCWLFSVQDITDRKRTEEQVREREELLSLTISAAALGLWDWNLTAGTITGDSRWRDMRGLPPSDTAADPCLWTTSIAPEDIDRIHEEVHRHATHPATPFDATWKVNHSQDGTRWVRNLGKIVSHDTVGRPARMLGVAIDVTPQREQEVLLQKLAHFDALTGLPNRVLLARRLQEQMHTAQAQGHQLGVAYLDLDGFKPVNDRLGHGAGDRLLVVVAGRLTRALRPVDCVARLGGDEFVILMPALAGQADCERLLRQVMDSISAPYTLDTERVVVTASIGYTMFPSDDADADTLLRHADQAMYAAKQAGRNRSHQFDAEQERAVQLQRTQGKRLREAMADGQFQLFLQPKVDMRSGAVIGAEALARWQHPERGILPPAAFLSLIEGTDLEIAFGQWVVEEALSMLEHLDAQGLLVPVSINIAAQHLQQAGFSDWMAQCLARHPGVPPKRVEIEITESAALYDLMEVAGALTDLRALGVSVSLDDFGTGYSSLTYLRRLPMDTLKIDRSFVHGMMGDPGDLAIVQGVVGLARSFGYRVIAEGVETVEQGQMLLQLGCLQAQGYCIARPMPVAEFIRWVPGWSPPAEWQRP